MGDFEKKNYRKIKHMSEEKQIACITNGVKKFLHGCKKAKNATKQKTIPQSIERGKNILPTSFL